MVALDQIKRLFWYDDGVKPEERATIHTPGAPVSSWAHKLFGFVANEDFSEDEAFASPLVWRAIKVLSEPMSSMPICVHEKQKNGDIVRIEDHPYEYLLNVEPSKYYSSYTWRDTSMHHLGLRGNSYSRLIYKGNGELAEVLLIDPDSVQDIFLQDNGLLYKINGLNKMLPGSEVLHFMWSSFNGFVGKNPIEAHKNTLILDRESREYAKSFYQKGAFLSGVLEGPTEMTQPAYDRLKNSWHDTYGGAKNAGTAAILEEGFKFNPIKLDPVSAAWSETQKHIATQVGRIWGVPLHMLMDLEKATFSNIEHQSLEFVKYSLMPWVRRKEDELNRKLFPTKKGKMFLRYDMSELLRGDLKSTADYITKMQINGNLSVNEVRRDYLQRPGVEGGEKQLVQGNNMMPLDKVGQQLQLNLADEANI